MLCVVLGGTLDENIKSRINSVDSSEMKSKGTHLLVNAIFKSFGFRTQLEFPAPYPREFYTVNGRIDLLADRDGYSVAVEVDAKTPRKKSILKLQGLRAFTSCQLVVVRTGIYKDVWEYESMFDHEQVVRRG